jgi:thymidylate kinase
MKATVALFFVLSLVLSPLLPGVAVLLPLVFALAFGAYGLARSASRHLDPLNDAPNALRVFLASLGGYFVTLDGAFIFPSAGVLLLLASVYLNDEYQRRMIDSLRRGRRGGSIALLGIDGSGKSSHSTVTSGWLEGRGYRVELMPFHRYLFVERLSSISSAVRGTSAAVSKRRNPLRPVLSLADNLLLQISTSLGCRIEGTVVVYDRFIWSTYIKYEALGYPVRPLSFLYLLPRPLFAIVLDVPVDKSLRVIDERVAHIHYPRSVLQHEREAYLRIANRNGYPVIDATGSFEDVQARIESHLAGLFPQVTGVGRR